MQKSLLVKYVLKGKIFSVIFSGGDRDKKFLIGKKLVIGSDPTLFWQIYNDKFPQKYDLIVKEDNKYYFNLRNTFTLEVKKNNQELDLNDLKNQGILKENRLYLSEDLEGKIILDENTAFEFTYITIKDTLTDEENKLLALIHKWPEATRQEKVTRYSVTAVILFVLILASIIGWNYVPPKKANLFDQELGRLVGMQVGVPITQEPETFWDESLSDEPTAEDGEGSEKVKADAARQTEISERQRARMKGNRSKTSDSKERYTGIAGSVDLSATGTGSSATIRSRVSGIKGANRNTGFEGVEVESGSGLSDAAARLRRQASDQMNAAVVTSTGLRASEVGGRRVAGISSTTTQAELKELELSWGDGKISIEELEAQGYTTDGVEGKNLIPIEQKPRSIIPEPQKQGALEDWFNTRLSLQINEKYNAFTARKTITGELTYVFVFKKDIVTSIRITGRGSIGDKEFTKSLESMIINKRLYNIGDYVGRVKRYYE